VDIRRFLHRHRHGLADRDTDLAAFARGLADGSVSDAQGAAFAMAVCKDGLSDAATTALTLAMRDSGQVLRWDLPGPVLDKHSTGGLGDATSLVLAPVLAVLGGYAPFLSGRGLGHTGGTLDKLEAIPGVRTEIGTAQLKRIVREVGCAVVSASADIAPADRRLYALRDHTSTVDSQPLIVASILSKKLAGGADVLVLDVKGGSGAFMKTRAEAVALARALVDTARAAGIAVRALITDMNQPLAPSVGNAVEIAEVLAVLRDPQPDSRLCQLSLALAGAALEMGGLATTPEEGGRLALAALQDGRAAERFGRMVQALGGPAGLMDRPAAHLPVAPVQRDVRAGRAGRLQAIDGLALGEVVVGMGGGRAAPADSIDPRVGLSHIAGLGQTVEADTPLARIHAADAGMAEAVAGLVRSAFQIGAEAAVPPLVHERIF
jgi:thymidine phosphorylase